MATISIEQELLELENEYWQALIDRDKKKIGDLSDDPCIVAGAQGIAKLDMASMLKMVESPTWSLQRFTIDPKVEVRLLGDDVAILAYKVSEELTVDGKSLTLDASDSSVWRRRGEDGWVCSLHTESLSGDPFGRDRSQK